MDAKQMRELLKEKRNQKFRKLTEKQIDGYNRNSETLREQRKEGTELHAKLTEINREKAKDPEYLKKLSESVSAYYEKPENRKKQSDAVKEAMLRPEVIEARKKGNETRDYTNISKANREKANRPDIIAKLSAHAKKMMNEPEHKERFVKLLESEEWLEANRQAQLRKHGHIVTPFGVFDNLNEADEITGLCIKTKMGALPHLYYRDKKGPGKAPTEVVWVSPYGEFRTVHDLYQCEVDMGLENGELNDRFAWFKKKVRHNPTGYYKEKMPRREWLLEKKLDKGE